MAQRPWTPADTAPHGWYDAQTAGSFTLAGSSVTAATARGGYGPALSPDGTVTYSATGFDGTLPALLSTGGRLTGNLPVAPGSTFTFWAMFNPAAGGNRCPIAVGVPDGNQGAGLSYNSGGNLVNVFVWGSTEVQKAFSAGTPVSLLATVTAGMLSLWVNGTLAGSVQATVNIQSQLVSVCNFATFPGCNITGEVGYVERVLTQDEIDRNNGYVAWRWGRQADLAADHPYRTAAPTVDDGAANTVSPGNAVQVQVASAPAVAARASSSPASAVQTQAATAASLAARSAVSPDSATQPHSSTSPAVTAAGAVNVGSASHGQIATSPAIAVQGVVIPAGSTQAQSATAPTIQAKAAAVVISTEQSQAATLPALRVTVAVGVSAATQPQSATLATVFARSVAVPAPARQPTVLTSPVLFVGTRPIPPAKRTVRSVRVNRVVYSPRSSRLAA